MTERICALPRCGKPIPEGKQKGTKYCCPLHRRAVYRQRPEAKAKRRAWAQTPEAKAKRRARQQTPEAKAKRRARRQTPEAKASRRTREQTPEAKAMNRARRQTPEAKAMNRARRQTPEAKAARRAWDKARQPSGSRAFAIRSGWPVGLNIRQIHLLNVLAALGIPVTIPDLFKAGGLKCAKSPCQSPSFRKLLQLGFVVLVTPGRGGTGASHFPSTFAINPTLLEERAKWQEAQGPSPK
jgi:hypothetical protein